MKKKQVNAAGVEGSFVRSRREKNAVKKKERLSTERGSGRFVFFLGDDGAVLIHIAGRKVLRRLYVPSFHPEHTESMYDLIRRYPKVPIYLLVDVMDQQYLSHSFPPVSSMSLGGLVQRRIARDFSADDINAAIRLGRASTGKKEWRYLLVSLTSTPLIQQWLGVLLEFANPFKGIFLSPIEAEGYIRSLHDHFSAKNERFEWQMFISHHKVGGFRQVVLHQGKLVFTRLSQVLDTDVAAVIAGSLEQEIIGSLEYLRRLGLVDMTRLELIVITGQEVRDALDLQRFGAGVVHALMPIEVAEILRLDQAALSADRYGDVLMAASFSVRNKPLLKLTTPYAKKVETLSNLKQVLLGATCVILAALGVGIFFSVQEEMQAAREKVELERMIQSLDPELRQKKAEDERLKGGNYERIKGIVVAHDAYIPEGGLPLEFVEKMAPFLNANVRVSKINWRLDVDRDAGLGQAQQPSYSGTVTPLIPMADVEIEFLGNSKDLQRLTHFVDRWVMRVKAGMVGYMVSVDSYPWLGREGQSMEISLDEPSGGLELPQGRKIIMHFKKTPPSAPANY